MLCIVVFVIFFFQAEDGIRDLVRSRGLGDVYKRQPLGSSNPVKSSSPVFIPLLKWITLATPSRTAFILSLIHI